MKDAQISVGARRPLFHVNVMPSVVGTICILQKAGRRGCTQVRPMKKENEETQTDTLIDQDIKLKRKTNKNTVKYSGFRCQRVFAKLLMVIYGQPPLFLVVGRETTTFWRLSRPSQQNCYGPQGTWEKNAWTRRDENYKMKTKKRKQKEKKTWPMEGKRMNHVSSIRPKHMWIDTTFFDMLNDLLRDAAKFTFFLFCQVNNAIGFSCPRVVVHEANE